MIDQKQKFVNLNACCMYVAENGVWFVQGMSPVLCFYSFENEKITIMQTLNIGEIYGTAYFSKVYLNNDEIYLIPNNSNKIVIYNIVNKKLEYISINGTAVNMYRNCYEMNGVLFFIPYKAKKIIKLRLDTHQIIGYIDVFENNGEDICLNSTCRVGNIVYCALWMRGEIVKIDLEKEIIMREKISEEYKFSQICERQKRFFLYDMLTKSILVYSKDFKKVEKIIEVGCEDALLIISKGGDILVDLATTDDILIIGEDFKGRGKITFRIGKQLLDIQPWRINTWGYDQNKEIWGISTNGFLFKFINNNQTIEKRELKVNIECHSKINKKLIQECKKNILVERNSFALSNYLAGLIN